MSLDELNRTRLVNQGVLAGRYSIVRCRGKGGFGSVEECLDLITGEAVAVKTIPAKFVNMESKRLIREIDIMAFLRERHPHLINFFSVFVTKAGVPESGAVHDADGKLLDMGSLPLLSAAASTHALGCGGNSHATGGAPSMLPSLVGAGSGGGRSNPVCPEQLYVEGPAYAGLTPDQRLIKYHNALTEACRAVTENDEYNLHFVMPLMLGDLFYFIKAIRDPGARQQLSVTLSYLGQVAVVLAFQICFGLDYLHKCNIIHRDMKPDNVLVELNIENPYYSSALIADMGLARVSKNSETFYVCTRYYRPPELVISSREGTVGIDIWSLGCVLYELCTGQTLFLLESSRNQKGSWDGIRASQQLESILNVIGTPSRAEIERYMEHSNPRQYLLNSQPRPNKLSEKIKNAWALEGAGTEEQRLWIDLICQCLRFFAQQRPTAEELCRHPLFRSYGVLYGENVKQYPADPYIPQFVEKDTVNSNRTQNKMTALRLVMKAMEDTRPVLSDDDNDNDRTNDDDDDIDVGQLKLEGASGARVGSSCEARRGTENEEASSPPVISPGSQLVNQGHINEEISTAIASPYSMPQGTSHTSNFAVAAHTTNNNNNNGSGSRNRSGAPTSKNSSTTDYTMPALTRATKAVAAPTSSANLQANSNPNHGSSSGGGGAAGRRESLTAAASPLRPQVPNGSAFTGAASSPPSTINGRRQSLSANNNNNNINNKNYNNTNVNINNPNYNNYTSGPVNEDDEDENEESPPYNRGKGLGSKKKRNPSTDDLARAPVAPPKRSTNSSNTSRHNNNNNNNNNNNSHNVDPYGSGSDLNASDSALQYDYGDEINQDIIGVQRSSKHNNTNNNNTNNSSNRSNSNSNTKQRRNNHNNSQQSDTSHNLSANEERPGNLSPVTTMNDFFSFDSDAMPTAQSKYTSLDASVDQGNGPQKYRRSGSNSNNNNKNRRQSNNSRNTLPFPSTITDATLIRRYAAVDVNDGGAVRGALGGVLASIERGEGQETGLTPQLKDLLDYFAHAQRLLA